MKIERHDRVAVLAMNAGKANAMGTEWFARMDALLDELLRSDARALVVTGYEAFFSAGFDLPSLIGLSHPELTAFIERFGVFMLRLFELPKPVVAGVNGHAIAGGCVLALQADERVMVEGTGKIGLSEVALGMGLTSGILEPLRCQVPASSLVPIALEGKLFLPREALAVGLVHEVAPQGELMDHALARARRLADLPPAAFAQVKAQIRGPVAAAIRAAMAQGDSARWVDVWFTPDAQERVKAAVARLSQKRS